MFMTADHISQSLREQRIKAGYTQEQLAAYLDMTQSDVSKIENGRKIPDAVTYENWLWRCQNQPQRYEFYYDRRRGQHA
ncbi:hypothetical protein ET33_21110 [Paenibacillus tyrfis]|uniref:HTH cro/C1-type domain-containing protein n=2 Tax=Paenibacillus tyrfis TaxID=1501230 RepID=A0A081NWM9_9BACL|nr:hypothetical protein ET33_21110 [Paenibacillus tyrfis]